MKGKDYIDKMETHQYENIYESDDVPFQDLTKNTVKHLVYYGIGLFMVLLILSFIIKVPREVNLLFELKGGLNETTYQYSETIYINSFSVQANDTINIGDTLATITSPKIVKYIEEFEIWNGKMNLFQTSKKKADIQAIALIETTIIGLENEIIKIEHEKRLAISASKNECKNLQLQVENSEIQHNRNIMLHDNQVISDSDFELSLQKVQIAEQELISRKEKYSLQVAEIESRLQKLHNTKKHNQININKQNAIFNYELETIVKNLDLAQKKIELNYGSFAIKGNSIVLISTVEGLVSLRSENEYELATSKILLRIQTDSLKYFAYAEAGTKDIGHIKPGTKAILKYHSFPHYYYGTMSAKVLYTSHSPAINGNFPVKLEIINSGKLKSRITKGMTGTASFVIEEKSIFDFILRSFLRVTTID